MQRVDPHDLIERHSHDVKAIAKAFKAKLPASFELDDLIQEGFIGLIGAAARWNPERNDSFLNYARPRILGAMKDSIRRSEWKNSTTISLDTMSADDSAAAWEPSSTPNYDEEIDRDRQLERVIEMAEYLPPDQRIVIRGHHVEGRTLLEVGQDLGVNNSRASAICIEAIERLRANPRLRFAA